MDFKHEQVMPNEDLPFRMFVFEGKNGNYKVPKHWHRSIEIFVVLEGVIDFYINSVQYRLQRGQLILVNSNEIHSIDATYKNFTLVLQIPRGIFLEHMVEDTLVFKRMYYQYDQELISVIKSMYQHYTEKRIGYQFDVLSHFYRLLYLLVNHYKVQDIDETTKRHNRQLEKLSVITQYIKDHYQEEITLESVADAFGFNATYLSKMFQKYAGINYKTYLMDIRVGEAYKELMNTSHSITDIAINNGFSDSRSFTKAFKKRFNTLPSTYRQNMKKTQESAINPTSFW